MMLERYYERGSDKKLIETIDDNYEKWITALEVDLEFRKMKYATKFVKKAKEKGCVEVSIENNNRPAISLYFKNGFYIYGSNKKQLFMRLRGSSKK